ncbi:glycoside hydrolase family 10 protein [Dethiothermospora halolimnae]|uniref:glycoside hydrolase family 10 protein n=1 Tax=Dethiothermospora halolimnae TaxID=3114390 RepID=UPI003CCBCE8A
MKNSFKIISILLIMVIFQSTIAFATPSLNTIEKKEMRGLWVSTVLNIDYPSKPTTDAEVLKKEAIKILDDVKDMGLNAVFLQVRPSGDALYPSKYFPWSKYLTGKQGVMPSDGFDPLKFWIDEAHKRGIQLHAWLNPYRITKKKYNEPEHDFASLDFFHPAIANPDWVVKHSDGNLYFNPGVPEVRELVMDGVIEIVENYDVDGIHFDDYFYPGKDFDDKDAFEKYGKGFENIHDWRRENVNILIGELSKRIKETSKDVSFGISPFGIWANKSTNPLGSNTKGMQSYYKQYADTRKWVKEEMIDYIVPQIYWHIGFSIADYSELLNWWVDTTKGTNVELYIGQAAYRAGNPDPNSPWHGFSEIERQLTLNSNFSQVKGSVFFTYNSFEGKPALSGLIKSIYQEKQYVMDMEKLKIVIKVIDKYIRQIV